MIPYLAMVAMGVLVAALAVILPLWRRAMVESISDRNAARLFARLDRD